MSVGQQDGMSFVGAGTRKGHSRRRRGVRKKVGLWHNHQRGGQCLFYVAAICASQEAPLWQTVAHLLLTVEFAGDRAGLWQKLQ